MEGSWNGELKVMTPTQLYWLTRLDGILTFCDVILFTFLGIGTLALVFLPIWEDHWEKAKSYICKSVLILLAVSAVKVLVPTTKEMAAILIVPKIMNNAKVQELPDKVLDLANSWLVELKPESKGEK